MLRWSSHISIKRSKIVGLGKRHGMHPSRRASISSCVSSTMHFLFSMHLSQAMSLVKFASSSCCHWWTWSNGQRIKSYPPHEGIWVESPWACFHELTIQWLHICFGELHQLQPRSNSLKLIWTHPFKLVQLPTACTVSSDDYIYRTRRWQPDDATVQPPTGILTEHMLASSGNADTNMEPDGHARI